MPEPTPQPILYDRIVIPANAFDHITRHDPFAPYLNETAAWDDEEPANPAPLEEWERELLGTVPVPEPVPEPELPDHADDLYRWWEREQIQVAYNLERVQRRRNQWTLDFMNDRLEGFCDLSGVEYVDHVTAHPVERYLTWRMAHLFAEFIGGTGHLIPTNAGDFFAYLRTQEWDGGKILDSMYPPGHAPAIDPWQVRHRCGMRVTYGSFEADSPERAARRYSRSIVRTARREYRNECGRD